MEAVFAERVHELRDPDGKAADLRIQIGPFEREDDRGPAARRGRARGASPARNRDGIRCDGAALSRGRLGGSAVSCSFRRDDGAANPQRADKQVQSVGEEGRVAAFERCPTNWKIHPTANNAARATTA